MYKIAAHGDDHVISSCQFFGFFNLIFMPIVKWVVFCNNSYGFHAKSIAWKKGEGKAEENWKIVLKENVLHKFVVYCRMVMFKT